MLCCAVHVPGTFSRVVTSECKGGGGGERKKGGGVHMVGEKFFPFFE